MAMASSAPVQDPLADMLLRVPPELFAVIDGAAFRDLVAEIGPFGLNPRPLYLEAADKAGTSAGPHLLALASEHETLRFLAFLAGRPAAVFWSWPDGSDALYRHLRRLNVVEIPAGARGARQPLFEKVLFRHADPNALATVLSVLTAEQCRELLGAAAGLVMVAPDFGGLITVPRPQETG